MLTAIALLALSACSPITPGVDVDVEKEIVGGGSSGLDSGTLNLTVDGQPFTPTSLAVAAGAATSNSPAVLTFITSNGTASEQNALSISVQMPHDIGVHTIGSNFFTGVLLRQGPLSKELSWEAINDAGSGVIEITSRTANRTDGRINATLAPAGVASSTRTVAGTFSVKF